LTPLEAAQTTVRLAGNYPDYLEALIEDPDKLVTIVADPATQGRLVILRLKGGEMIAFTWCYIDQPLTEPPQAADWERQRGVAVWLADMVSTPGLSGITIGRAMHEALASMGITKPGQLIVHYRHRTHRYGGVIARASGKKPDVEVLFPTSKPRRH
jgi:hypothetical protein